MYLYLYRYSISEWDRDNPIAKFVRRELKANGMTQPELVDLTGLGLRFVRNLEQGKHNLMTGKVNQILIFFGHSLQPMRLTKEELSRLLA